MSLFMITWISFFLFLLHEFEEIVLIKPWLAMHKHDKRAEQQVFWRERNTATETIAVLIFEEIILFFVVGSISVIWAIPGLLVGFLIPYALHLITHITEAVRLGMRTPPVVSAAVTLPWFCYAIPVLSIQVGSVFYLLGWLLFGVGVLVLNFKFIYGIKQAVGDYLYPSV